MVIKLIKLLTNSYYPLVKIELIFTTEIVSKGSFVKRKEPIKLNVNILSGVQIGIYYQISALQVLTNGL